MEPTFTSDDIAAVAESQPAGAPSAPHTPEASTTETPPIAAAGSAESPQDKRGSMPMDRHEAVLANARREYESKLARLSWAESLDPNSVARALALAELREAERGNGNGRTAEAPVPDLKTEDGLPLYSATQAAALVRHEVQQAVEALRRDYDAKLTPLEQRSRQADVQEGLLAQIDKARAWAGFTDHIAEIAEALESASQRHEYLSLHDAYINVVVPKLVASKESLMAEARKANLDEINKTTQQVKGDFNPGRSPSASHKADKDKSWGELIEETVSRLSAST